MYWPVLFFISEEGDFSLCRFHLANKVQVEIPLSRASTRLAVE